MSEVTHLRVSDIDSQRMMIRIEQGKGTARGAYKAFILATLEQYPRLRATRLRR